MVLELHGFPYSTCTRRVATVLHEKKVPFVLVPIDLRTGQQKAPDHVKIQPFGQVPYIVDDGFVLYESRAICQNAIFEQAASIEYSNFDPAAATLVLRSTSSRAPFPVHDERRNPDEAIAKRLIDTLTAKLEVYDVILGKQKYLAGDKLTLADLFHLPYGSLLPEAGTKVIETKPNVARWFKELQSRDSWQAVHHEVKSTA
ncbi:thioredoxin-like protein [Infundibulicybe gibba]|nr:thioredoxin-like protein [Infundibulicybe gibba]